MTRLRFLLLPALVLVLGLAVACTARKASAPSSGASRQSSVEADRTGTSAAAPAQADAFAAKNSPAPVEQRDVVETATIAVNVKDVDKAADTLGAAAISAGGRIDGDNRNSDTDGRRATLVLRVPGTKLTDLIDKAKGLGEELHRTRKGEDMTAAHADVNARILALQDSVDRISDFLKKSGTINDLVRAEQELTQRQSELDSLTAQKRALEDQIDLASLTVDLTAKPVLAPLPVEHKGPLGFGAALAKGWHSVVTAARYVAAGTGYVLPYALLVAVFGAPILMLAIRRRGQKRTVQQVPVA